jgi:hypothetical protein
MRKRETFVNAKGEKQGSRFNPYLRSSSMNSNQDAATYVPGMHEDAPGISSDVDESENITPTVGFLYSISRRGIGEYWPLHLGTNVIGRASDCDVRLQEMSVSDHHAAINIKQMKTTNRLIASIRDIGSKNGLFLNAEELDYENHSCKANDIIVIGRCYKLLLLLVDAEQCGLSIAEDFVPTNESLSDNDGEMSGFTQGRFNPYDSMGRNVDTGTVDLSGSQFDEPGKTKFL